MSGGARGSAPAALGQRGLQERWGTAAAAGSVGATATVREGWQRRRGWWWQWQRQATGAAVAVAVGTAAAGGKEGEGNGIGGGSPASLLLASPCACALARYLSVCCVQSVSVAVKSAKCGVCMLWLFVSGMRLWRCGWLLLAVLCGARRVRRRHRRLPPTRHGAWRSLRAGGANTKNKKKS